MNFVVSVTAGAVAGISVYYGAMAAGAGFGVAMVLNVMAAFVATITVSTLLGRR